MFKRFFGLIIVGVMSLSFCLNVIADGLNYDENKAFVNAQTTFSDTVGRYATVGEVSTGSVIFEKNSGEIFHMGHLAKLMAVYLTARQIESGEISLQTSVTVSKSANSQNGTQIWLNVGEKISVEELLKSICMGNANDACYCLGELLFKNEEIYINVANQTAVSLGMENTHFGDITGQNEMSVTTAEDMWILAGEISKYDYLQEYFCTWIDNVRGGQTQLVNTNRLVRNYEGIFGMKACYDDEWKNSVVAVAKRDGMTFISVIVGCEDVDESFSESKKMLDFGFSQYVLYTPEIPKEAVKKITVKNGAENSVRVEVKNIKPVLVKKNAVGNITCAFEVEEFVNAPVKKGQTVGQIRFLNDEGIVFEGEILTKKPVLKMNFAIALKRLWLNLLNFE